jgi:hypothetical protein
MYPKKKFEQAAQEAADGRGTARAEKEAIVADENERETPVTGNPPEATMGSSDQVEPSAPSHYRMNLRSRDAPPGAPRISYAEDLRQSYVDEEDDDDEDDDMDCENNEEDQKPSSKRHKRTSRGDAVADDPHAYNGHRFGRRGDPRMSRALQFKLDNPKMDCTLALIKGGYHYNLGASEKALDEDGIMLGQRRNQLARRIRNEVKKAGRVQSSRPKKRPAASRNSGNRKTTAKRKSPPRKRKDRKPKMVKSPRSVSFSTPQSISALPTPSLHVPPMNLAYLDEKDLYDFANIPLPPLPGGVVETQQPQHLQRIQSETLKQLASPYISDISDVEQEGSLLDGKSSAAATSVPPFPMYQGAPLIPSLPITPPLSFVGQPISSTKKTDETDSVVGENLLEEDMLGLTEEEKKEAHDDVHGNRELESSLMQAVMNKFLRINIDSAQKSIRENEALGKSMQNLMSPAVQDLIRQMKVAIEARPAIERNAMLKAFVHCSPAQRQVEFGDERLELFLRREHMDPVAAAARFVKYWVKRKELFGPDKYLLPLTIDGALKDDHVALEVGHWIILPKPDNFGRTIMLWLKRGPYDYDSMVRNWAGVGKNCFSRFQF